jgi:uncharacterized membrane protein YebE (DUF533 family)
MMATGLFDQLLRSGQDLFSGKPAAGQGGGGPLDALGGLFNKDAGGGGIMDTLGGLFNPNKGGGTSQLGSFLTGAGGGVLAGSALSLLLGNKNGSELVGNVLTYGGMAAVGAIAYKAYNNWQANQTPGIPLAEPRTLDRLPQAQAEEHSRAILLAMITAAKADGHVDEREQGLMTEALAKLGGNNGEVRQWLAAELNKPLDPAAVARAATTPEMAAEIYIASVLVVNEEHFLERAYLDELARQLHLEPGLKSELEQQVKLALAKG